MHASFIAAVLTLIAITSSASASPPIRCNGRIQFRPCGEPYPNGAHLNLPLEQSTAKLAADLLVPLPQTRPLSAKNYSPRESGIHYARIAKQEFRKLPLRRSTRLEGQSLEGQWRGIVEGNGLVHMELRIERAGQVESTWYLGSVRLDRTSTFFSFKAPIPTDSDWTWDLVAYSTTQS